MTEEKMMTLPLLWGFDRHIGSITFTTDEIPYQISRGAQLVLCGAYIAREESDPREPELIQIGLHPQPISALLANHISKQIVKDQFEILLACLFQDNETGGMISANYVKETIESRMNELGLYK